MQRFISFEGIDGSGKSTQINLLKTRLEGEGYGVTTVREPGGNQLSEKIRDLLLDHRNLEMHDRTETLLFSAARAQLVIRNILPALKRADFVLCDRFADSTIAYQGYGRGLPLEEIRIIQRFATTGIQPAVAVLLDLPAEDAAARLLGAYADRMERAGLDFQNRIRSGYLELAASDPDRWFVIDGTRSAKDISTEIWSRVYALYFTKSAETGD